VSNSEKITWDYMPSYGLVPFQQLIEAVAEATIGDRHFNRHDVDPERFIGHQMVSGINYNSLNRIVSAFILAERKRAELPASN